MSLTPPPSPPPNRSQTAAVFNAAVSAFVAWLSTFVAEMDDLSELLLGLLDNEFVGTSTTSVLIGTGAKSLTLQPGLSFAPGQTIVAARTSVPTNAMFGTVTSYNGTTGALVMNAAAVTGSGTYTDWTVSLLPSGGSVIGAALYTAADAAAARTAIGVGRALITNNTFSASGAPGTALGGGFNSWEVEFTGLIPSAGLTIAAQLSFDSGGSWKTGASDYAWVSRPLTNVAGILRDSADAGFRVTTSNMDTTASKANSVILKIHGPRAAGFGCDLSSKANYWSGGEIQIDEVDGQSVPGYGAPTNVRLFCTGGTLTGAYAVYGLPGF